MSVTDGAENALGRKLGPLPVYGWAAIGIGALVAVRVLGGGRGGGAPSTVTVPDAFSGDAGGGGGDSSSAPTGSSNPPVTPPSWWNTAPSWWKSPPPIRPPVRPLPPTPMPGGGTIPTPPHRAPSPPTAPTIKPATYRVSILGHVAFYNLLGKLNGHGGSSGTYTATITRIGTRTFYKFTRSGIVMLLPTSSPNIKAVRQ